MNIIPHYSNVNEYKKKLFILQVYTYSKKKKCGIINKNKGVILYIVYFH